jgi:hypothetical protein
MSQKSKKLLHRSSFLQFFGLKTIREKGKMILQKKNKKAAYRNPRFFQFKLNQYTDKSPIPLDRSMMIKERRLLMFWAFFVLIYLTSITLTCIWGLLLALAADDRWLGFPLQPLICVFAGTLGSAIRAIRSACERIAYGWELSDGTPLPQEKPKGKFGARLVPGFLLRPFIGSAAGLALYLGALGGALILLADRPGRVLNTVSLAFFAFVVGLFAKTFLDNLFSSLPKKNKGRKNGKNGTGEK